MKLPFKLPHKAEERNRVVGLLIGAAVAVIFSVIHILGPRASSDIDLDLKFTLRQKLFESSPGLREKYLPINKDIIFIEIDDATLELLEETFPDDPIFYKEVIEKYGKDNVGSMAMLFSKDYSKAFARKVDPEVTEVLKNYFNIIYQTLADAAGKKEEIVNNLDMLEEYLAGDDGASYASDIAGRIEEMIYDDDVNSLNSQLQGVGGFVQAQAELADIAPNREHIVATSMELAGNVYFIYEAENKLETPYSAKDLKSSGSIRPIFEKVMRYPTLNRPEDPKEGLVYDTYQNLGPEKLEFLLKGEGKEFEADIAERIANDMELRQHELDKFMAQQENMGLIIDAPENVKGVYVELRKVKPVFPTIGMQTVGQGVYKAEVSADGKLRKIAPAFIFHDKLFMHIDLLLAAKYLQVENKDIVFESRRVTLKNPVRDGKKIPDIVIPLLDDGTMLINWTGIWADTTTFKHKNLMNVYNNIYREIYLDQYQAFMADLEGFTNEEIEMYINGLPQDQREQFDAIRGIAENISPEQEKELRADIESLKDKIVVIGLTAVGTEDLNPVPLEARYPILGMHANVLNTIIEDMFIHQAPEIAVIVIFFALALILGFFGGVIHHKSLIVVVLINILIIVITAGLYTVLANYLFIVRKIEVPILNPLLLSVLTFLLVFLYRFVTEEQEKRKMQGMFSTYVNKEVVDTLIEDPDKLKLGGDWVNCTCFFSDVAGFTSISESMPPEDLVELLNEYLTAMTDIVFEYGGTLDKYIGDAIVAIYGAPIPIPDHARRACHSTIDMQVKLEQMRAAWKEQGKTELTARCGINTGKMIVGNMGSVKRFNYTAMGENFDFGEHMESGGKKWGTVMTICETTYEEAKEHIICRCLDVDFLEDEPVRIYQLIEKAENGISDEMKKGIAIYEDALKLYFERKWDEAIEMFKKVYDHIPDDQPTKKAIGRAEDCKADPPGEEFDRRAAHYLNKETAEA